MVPILTARRLCPKQLQVTVVALLGAASDGAEPSPFADFGRETGRIRPELHSSGFGPQICSCPQSAVDDLRSMGFKAARTHDWALVNKAERVCDYFHMNSRGFLTA